LLKGRRYTPRVVITDKLKSYAVAKRELLPNVQHPESRYLNNRAENSRRPTPRRDRNVQLFKSAQQAQRFLSPHSLIYEHFHPRRNRMSADQYGDARAVPFKVWNQEKCVPTTA
jgi:putative transposase